MHRFTVLSDIDEQRLIELLEAESPGSTVVRTSGTWVVRLSRRVDKSRCPASAAFWLFNDIHRNADWVPDATAMATQHQMLTDAYEAHIGPTPDVDAPHVDDLDAIRTTVRLASVLKRTATIELLDAARTDGRIRPGMSAVELYAQGITPPLHDIIVDDILGACLALRSLADTYLEHCDGSWDVAYADDDRRWDFTRTPGNRTLEQLADAGISSSVASRRSMGIPT